MLRLSQKLLPILQLTRMALVFTALADSLCALLLWAARRAGPGMSSVWGFFDARQAAAVALTSVGLYGFGMSLNDIIDRRRDQQIAAHRPLPSGRIGLRTAHATCALFAAVAVAAGAYYSAHGPRGYLSLLIISFTLALIAFYDLAGKYLVAPGLLTLGLIRFFHASFPNPQLAVPWHPLLLLNHITILSAVGYQWEQKRPPLTKRHWWAVFGGLAAVDALLIGVVAWRRQGEPWAGRAVAAALSLRPGLAFPAVAAAAFVAAAAWVRRRHENPRQAGQTLMLLGLLWLIVYDAAFVAGYVGYLPAAVVLLLLPVAYFSVQILRWWSKVLALSQRPAFRRVET